MILEVSGHEYLDIMFSLSSTVPNIPVPSALTALKAVRPKAGLASDCFDSKFLCKGN